MIVISATRLKLKTNVWLNYLKLSIALVIIFSLTIGYSKVNWGGVEVLLYMSFIGAILWCYRIKYFGVELDLDTPISLQLRINAFGSCKLKLETKFGIVTSNTNLKSISKSFVIEEQGYNVEIENYESTEKEVDIKVYRVDNQVK